MFEVGELYRRQDVHKEFGGQHQTGISMPANQPMIFLFFGGVGERHGYHDHAPSDGVFSYMGEGRTGDMTFTRGNAAILEHAASGKDLHLFRSIGRGMIEYLGQMVCAGYQVVPDQLDSQGQPRNAIQFHLIALSKLTRPLTQGNLLNVARERSATYTTRETNPKAVDGPTTRAEAVRRVRERTEATALAVLQRARGRCEGCGELAPFLGKDGTPYLEPHHVRRQTDGGPEDPAWVIALCPNCHRRAHHGIDHVTFNNELKKQLSLLKAEAP